jgi:hypothetical protein
VRGGKYFFGTLQMKVPNQEATLNSAAIPSVTWASPCSAEHAKEMAAIVRKSFLTGMSLSWL